ncbi:MAG: hypothetical protein RJA99_1997 [Pseudomonadota bacterium]
MADVPRPPWLSGARGDWSIALHVQPGASRSTAAGDHDGCLKLRIAAPPVEGRANDALRAFVAARLGVPRSAVTIERGDASRRKRVRVAADCEAADLVARLATYQGDAP